MGLEQTAVRLAEVNRAKAVMPSIRLHIVLSGDEAGAVTFRPRASPL